MVEYDGDDYVGAFNAFTLMCATSGIAYYQQQPR